MDFNRAFDYRSVVDGRPQIVLSLVLHLLSCTADAVSANLIHMKPPLELAASKWERY